MNRQTKLAIVIAPFLAIGGYIATGYFLKGEEQDDEQLLKLQLNEACNLSTVPCKLSAEGLSLELSDNNGTTRLVSSYPLERVMISFLDQAGTESLHQLKPDRQHLSWEATTDFPRIQSATPGPVTVRISAGLYNLIYLHEFQTGL